MDQKSDLLLEEIKMALINIRIQHDPAEYSKAVAEYLAENKVITRGTWLQIFGKKYNIQDDQARSHIRLLAREEILKKRGAKGGWLLDERFFENPSKPT